MLVGIDVGGTFTDLVLYDDDGQLSFVKLPSTPHEPSLGVINALRLMAEQRRISLEELLGGITIFIHGTTVATNILVQRKGARLGLITTKGFRDLLELREGARNNRYKLRVSPPEPIVPRPQRLEVAERISSKGEITLPLDENDVRDALSRLHAMNIEAVVVCLLHAHINPAHELSVYEIITRFAKERDWHPFISVGHKVLDREGEFDRLSTAAVNAYVGPGLHAYLNRLLKNLKNHGIRAPVFVMQSNGGVLPIAASAEHAVGAVTSGPAGGAMAGALFAKSLGLRKLVTYDTGGTSTDICVILDGVPIERSRTEIADQSITAPTIDINPIGIGGGSIARLDAAGILSVGPQSAGAIPGPACFMKGGRQATLTDANLILGLLSADSFLNGRLPLSVDAARAAIATDVAEPLGISVEEAAWAIHTLANSTITEGIRLATVRRGEDPRDFALMAFGGAGGLHANAVARELQIPRVIVPRMASVFSALGFLAADIRRDLQTPIGQKIRNLTAQQLKATFAALEGQGRTLLQQSSAGAGKIRFVRSVECRYARQTHGITVPLTGEITPAAIEAAFTETYRTLYQHSHDGAPVIVDCCRVSMFRALPQIRFDAQVEDKRVDTTPSLRRVYIGKPCDVPVYALAGLSAGARISGPAIIESSSTTVLIDFDATAEIDPIGNIVITTGVLS